MFGLKIRAWMDNIVRTKKKSKSKHSISSSGANSIMVGSSPSMIRRSEISPLQNTVINLIKWHCVTSPAYKVSSFFSSRVAEEQDGKIESSSATAGRRHVEFANGDDRFRYNYRSEEVKKVIIETRPHSKRNSSDDKKHYSQSSGISDFGSVMNYISSPESAEYSTGYSTLHSDDCLSPPKALDTDAPKPEYYVKSHNGMAYTPTIHMDVPVPLTNNNNNPSNISYVDSPSPRQRSRIRTNPWYKTQAAANGNSLTVNGSCGGLSSKPSSPTPYRSHSNCSSPSPSRPFFKGCDIELKGKFNGSPNSLRKRKLVEMETSNKHINDSVSVDSLNEDDDSTLKEIMGKFDEISYTYDKETDILSDSSDHTQCQEHSDYEDTGQDAEDEYEEEIDFIDKHAVSISESIQYKNSGSCEYYLEKQPQPQISRASLKLRKRIRRTRKRSECSTPGSGSEPSPRECRSVGGTPILNRRATKQSQHASTDRCNSLTTLNSPQKTLITIAESEKQLLKSDLEAFIKYRELITEAETLLGSFADTNAYHQAAAHQVTRNHPHLPNKRVEMLRAEVGSKRSVDVLTNNQHSNTCNSNAPNNKPPGPSTHKLPPSCHLSMKPQHSSPLPVHKKIELLKQEQYAFGPPSPQSPVKPKVNAAKENHPPPYYSPKPMHRIQVASSSWMNCPKSEPMKRKVYVPPSQQYYNQEMLLLRGAGSNKNLKQEMILKTLEDLRQSLEDQKTQLYTLNEKP